MTEDRPAGSLRSRLITALVLLVVVVATIAAGWTYHRALVEAEEAQDGLLTRVSELVALPGDGVGGGGATDGSGLVVEEIDGEGGPHTLPRSLPDGLSTVDTAAGGQRVMVRTLDDGRRLAVAQPIAVREDAVRETLVSTMVPIALAVPLLVAAAWVVVSWSLRPVEALRRELEQREDGSLAPLTRTDVPAELGGFLDALDEHHRRAATVLEGQRRFAAEAAHELRTPIAAVSLQAEHLVDAETDEDRARRATILRQGLNQVRALCDQLLVLGDETSTPDATVLLEEVARGVAGDLARAADDVGTEVCWDLEGAAGATVPGAATRIVLQNLVQNAIRYGGAFGPVDVRAYSGDQLIRIEVLDEGPGIKDPQRVLDAFHREAGQDVPGTGLGLAITARVLDRLGGELELLARPGAPGGTLARVTLPQHVTVSGTLPPAPSVLPA